MASLSSTLDVLDGDFSHPAPPSSPPAMPPSSPLPTEAILTKKRSREDPFDESSSSSDPAIFSDDGLDRSLEDYATRRKRKYRVGTWWKHEEPAPKAEIQRNIDSGVWLPSDGSADSDTAPTTAVSQPTTPRRHRPVMVEAPKTASPQRTYHKVARPLSFGAASEPQKAIPPDPEAYAKRMILKCLEDGRETIDLMGIGLRELSDDALVPLHGMIRYPHRDDGDAPSSDNYQSFTPNLQLFLSRNSLRHVPGELWRLENITVLSLRNNKLQDLPPAITKLHNLVELNISGNRLRWLPWELLRLLGGQGRLSKLNAAPNPFMQGMKWHSETKTLIESRKIGPPTDSQGLAEELRRLEEEMELNECRADLAWLHKLDSTIKERMLDAEADDDHQSRGRYPWKRDPIYVASSAVSWIQCDGSLSKGSPPLPTSAPSNNTLIPGSPNGHQTSSPPASTNYRVPSLAESALRCLSLLPRSQIDTIPAILPEDIPGPVMAFVHTLVKNESPRERKCSVCDNVYVLARAEWIEYWHYAPDSMYCSADLLFLPFLRRACSWGCAEEVQIERMSSLSDQ